MMSVHSHWVTSGLNASEGQQIIDNLKDKYVAENGEPSKMAGHQKLRVYYWRTEITENKAWPCVLAKPHLQLDLNLSQLVDKRYRRAWSAAASKKHRQ